MDGGRVEEQDKKTKILLNYTLSPKKNMLAFLNAAFSFNPV